MKKLIIAILVVSLLAFALTACGNNRNNDGDSKETTKVTDKMTEKPKDSTPDTMLDPEDGKISDTGTESSILDPIESGLDTIETGIENGMRRMMGK